MLDSPLCSICSRVDSVHLRSLGMPTYNQAQVALTPLTSHFTDVNGTDNALRFARGYNQIEWRVVLVMVSTTDSKISGLIARLVRNAVLSE